jgi:D-3-phosphoglycerate dehydrogenase / 2-oxoglutarate reductase
MTTSKKNIAIIFAEEDSSGFDRNSFSLLGRPSATYPILAALHAKKVDHVFLSSKTPAILQAIEPYPSVRKVQRGPKKLSLTEEIKFALKSISQEHDIIVDNVVILLGNSPCVLSQMIDTALEIMDDQGDIDSVVSVEKMRGHSPSSAMKLTENNRVEFNHYPEQEHYEYFMSCRLVITRPDIISRIPNQSKDHHALVGKNIHPLIQEEGITDIDYIWQVPQAERWLRMNGFAEGATPYPEQKKFQAGMTSFTDEKTDRERLKVFISTVPFGEINSLPVDILEKETRCEFHINPLGRKLKEEELEEFIEDVDILIAGTEPVTRKVMDKAKRLKLISRVGIGLDSVDLIAAREKGIHVSYTPDAPAPAVAELTMGHMMNLNRSISLVDRKLREGIWQRIMGERISNQTIGIIGTGRVGARVLKHLQGFSPRRILVNDINPTPEQYELLNAELVEKETIYREADIISLHVPLTPLTSPLIGFTEIEMMKPNVSLINTARGGMIDEKALYEALKNKKIRAAAIDVFMNEPYSGELAELDNCFLTCHMGSCSSDCRFDMEHLATEEALRYIRNEDLKFSVPDDEFKMQEMRTS